MQDQNPWIFAKYAKDRQLLAHPNFKWVHTYIKDTPHVINTARQAQKRLKDSSAPKFKFGVQVPQNAAHALKLDEINGDHLWQEATDTELGSINKFKTFWVLKKGESILPGYRRIPYHMIFDVKFDGRRKCRLVAGGHRTPDVPPEEVHCVVSMDTI